MSAPRPKTEHFRYTISGGTPSETTITVAIKDEEKVRDVQSNADIYKIGLAFLTGNKSEFKHLDAPTSTQREDMNIFKYRIAFRLFKTAAQDGVYGPPFPGAEEKAQEAYLKLQEAQKHRIERRLDGMMSSEVRSERKKIPENAADLRQKLFSIEATIAKLSEELEFETYGPKKIFKFRDADSELIAQYASPKSGSLKELRQAKDAERKEKEEQKASPKTKQIYQQLQTLSEQRDQLSKSYRGAFHEEVHVEGGMFDRRTSKKMLPRQHAFDPTHPSEEGAPESPAHSANRPGSMATPDSPASGVDPSPISPSSITLGPRKQG